MPKTRTTLTIDVDVLKAVKVKAARTGKGESELIEEAVRSSLGFSLLEKLWEQADLSEAAAMEQALEAQGAVRRSET